MTSGAQPQRFLGGLRVVEIAEMLAGPYAAKLLGDLGADVVKVEPLAGDRGRGLGPFIDGDDVGGDASPDERSIPFLHVNTSKRSIAIDIQAQAMRSVLPRLADRAEIVITDRPVAMVDPRALLARNPRLVVLALSPFGTNGPHRDWVATPFTTFHSAGEGYLTPVQSQLMPEVVDRPPLRQGRFAAEYKLATYAATLALCALFHARATGIGQIIELSEQDALIGLNFFEFATFMRTNEPPTRASLGVRFGGILPCKDGYLQFTFHEDHQWKALARVMGDPEWTREEWTLTHQLRLDNGDEINRRVTQWLSTRTRDEIVKAGQAAGCTVAAYLSLDEVAASEQMSDRGFFRTVARATGGGTYPTAPWRFSGASPEPTAAPLLGEHTDTVLAELGFTTDSVEDMRRLGAIR